METRALSDRLAAFAEGSGQPIPPPEVYACHECGYTSDKRRNFRKDGDSRVCHTGHFTDDDGQPQRVKNTYARWW